MDEGDKCPWGGTAGQISDASTDSVKVASILFFWEPAAPVVHSLAAVRNLVSSAHLVISRLTGLPVVSSLHCTSERNLRKTLLLPVGAELSALRRKVNAELALRTCAILLAHYRASAGLRLFDRCRRLDSGDATPFPDLAAPTQAHNTAFRKLKQKACNT